MGHGVVNHETQTRGRLDGFPTTLARQNACMFPICGHKLEYLSFPDFISSMRQQYDYSYKHIV